MDLARAAVRAVGADHLDLEDRAAQLVAGVVDRNVVDHRDAAVRHRVAQVGEGVDLDAKRRSQRQVAAVVFADSTNGPSPSTRIPSASPIVTWWSVSINGHSFVPGSTCRGPVEFRESLDAGTDTCARTWNICSLGC